MANRLKHSCHHPRVFHNIVQRHRPYLIRFWKDYEFLLCRFDAIHMNYKVVALDLGTKPISNFCCCDGNAKLKR